MALHQLVEHALHQRGFDRAREPQRQRDVQEFAVGIHAGEPPRRALARERAQPQCVRCDRSFDRGRIGIGVLDRARSPRPCGG